MSMNRCNLAKYIVHTYVLQESELPKRLESFSVDQIPEDHKCLKIKKLEDEGKKAFDIILAFMASPHISRYIYKTMGN